jgi:glycosyltransferase involved in cell wall biosynthesis
MVEYVDQMSAFRSVKYPLRLRILVISPSFPPQADSEAFCGAKWVSALQEAGVDVVVLTDSNVGEARAIDASPAWGALHSSTLSIGRPQNRELVRSVSCALRYQTWAWARWVDEIVRIAELIHNQSPFDLIVARSVPWKACVAAFWVAKKIRRPWIANLNDPWELWKFSSKPRCQPNRSDRVLMRFWLQRCLRSAAKVNYPCSRLAGYFARTGRVAHRASIIPHIGWVRQGSLCSGRFTLVHAGKLGANEATSRRSSLSLLRGLGLFFKRHPYAKRDCRLIFVGPEDATSVQAILDLNLSDQINSVGRVSYEESLRYIGQATVCVLVEGHFQEGIFLPSKLVDYLVARKPVLALSPRVGTVADLAAGQGVFRVDPDDVEGVASHLQFMYERFRRGELVKCEPPESLSREFEPRTVAGRFLNLMEEVLSSKACIS